MKKLKLLILILALTLFITGCDVITLPWINQNDEIPSPDSCTHQDDDDNGRCDICTVSVVVSVDFFAVNDLHGKFDDTDANCGVDELTTYFKNIRKENDNVILLSSGDMWQGSSESNLTRGMVITEWMNHLDFASMTLGNHEYDWGEEYIEANREIADFPFLAINIFDTDTDERVDYCDASVVIEQGGIQIGIIGAIGDCYSSVSGDKSENIYFKTGYDLTLLVKNEAERLRADGVDFIVYSIHDGYGKNKYSVSEVSDHDLRNYYNTSLSDGYVDLVFEGHTHQSYVLVDKHNVYHLQNGGENKGISHVEVNINTVNNNSTVTNAEFVPSSQYKHLNDDPIVDDLLEKYKDEIEDANIVLGYNDRKRPSYEIKQLVADLYFEYGNNTWGEDYNIVLGGGFISTRSPYDIYAGEVSYRDVQSVLPFDNQLVLCSIQGQYLISQFFESSNKNYYIKLGVYGEEVKDNIIPDETYYVITDTYSSSYAPNHLTVIESLDDNIFARDLVADHIRKGGWTSEN